MTLSLSATPTIVARETGYGAGARWDWVLPPEDVGVLRLALSDGLVGTAQRRDRDGGWVLLAWSVSMQRQAAEAAAAKREQRRQKQFVLAPAGYTPRIYRAQAIPRAMRTHAPYQHEPAYW